MPRMSRRVSWALGSLVALVAAVAVGAASRGEAAAQAVPANTSPPVISGVPEVGATLTASTGTWTGTTPMQFAYAWQRCDATGGNCAVVAGSTTQAYPLENADARSTIRVVVTATNADGSASATSVPTAVITGPTTVLGCPPVQQAGPLDLDETFPPARLLVDRMEITPRPVLRTTQVIRLRFHVVACDARDVRGALVYATPTPYQQFDDTEAATGNDGWATLTMRRLRFFPATAQQRLLIVFVRARKPGEELLGGISLRRRCACELRHVDARLQYRAHEAVDRMRLE